MSNGKSSKNMTFFTSQWSEYFKDNPFSRAMLESSTHFVDLMKAMPVSIHAPTLEQFMNISKGASAPADTKRDKATEQAAEKPTFTHPHPYVGLHPDDVVATVMEFSEGAASNPAQLAEHQTSLARDLMAVLSGKADLEPEDGDKRFADPEWDTNPFYRNLKQGYLAWSKSLHGVVDATASDQRSALRMGYLARLVTEAMAPSNTLLGNPTAIRKAVESGGSSLLEGMRNMLDDMVSNKGMPSHVDKSAFKVGGNLAVSKGAVVYSNPVLELIQYTPTTGEVYARPQILVPPQINKFYLLDMAPGRSMVEFLVGRGFQVFMVSWRNPTAEHRDWGLETFAQAVLEAIEAVRAITGAETVNVHSICGGTRVVSALLGHLAASGNTVVNAATLVVGVLISNEDPLGPFADEDTIAAAKRKTAQMGVLCGSELSRTFTWAKPKDLVWSYWVRNYLMGEAPAANDILFWNTDSTRLTARLHAESLDIFSKNLFAVPGGLTILGTPVDLTQVACDAYVVGGLTDHLAPWQWVYNAVRRFKGNNRFVLSSGGHVQSIVTPPSHKKVRHYLNDQTPDSPEAWLEGAREMAGSWWLDWAEWMAARSGQLRPAPTALGSDAYRPGVAAPGTYVFET